MSLEASFDLRGDLIENLRETAGMYLRDLACLTEEQAASAPMGEARPALLYTVECAVLNRYAAASLEGRAGRREMNQFQPAHSILAAQSDLTSSVDELARILGEVDEARLFRRVVAPWGERLPAYRLVQKAVLHMAYHLGQVNYVQTLYGDAENRWGRPIG